MSVLSDKWIKKAVKNERNDKTFCKQTSQKKKFLSDYLHMDMMQEFLMNLRYLLM